MWRGISLANKCLLLFGTAVVLIIAAALTVSGLRMSAIGRENQLEQSRQLVRMWEQMMRGGDGFTPSLLAPVGIEGDGELEIAGGRVRLQTGEPGAVGENAFARRAWSAFSQSPARAEYWEWERVDGGARTHNYAKAVRSDDSASSDVAAADEAAAASLASAPTAMVLVQRRVEGVAGQWTTNLAYLISAGLIALGLAVGVFYLITTRLILQPVRSLKDTAEMVREGNLNIRADLRTGDEFEELGEMFNQMLEALAGSQDQLRALNAQLDLRLNELTERNVSLFEANRLKGEFLANVSHELRTPLNSIIGFTELLLEIAEREAEAGDDSSRLAKRRRYLDNINTAGRSLLEMINGLLDMAKAEAGKLDLRIEPINVRDACEALLALIRPLADRAGIELVSELGEAGELPPIETDSQKFQQIVFNLLSNAVKFTGEHHAQANGQASGTAPGQARVTLRAERVVGRASEGPASEDRLRVSVLDTGPGISSEDLPRLFEKFQQLDSGHTRRHAGTGLGLAICKELSSLLQGEIQVQSEPGRGSMFSVIFPLKLDPVRADEARHESSLRAKPLKQPS